MSARREGNLDKLLRMRDRGAAGDGIDAMDARHLAAWVDRAIARGTTLDDGADLAPGWQAKAASMLARLVNWGTGESFRATARELRAELGRYVRSGRFERHLAGAERPSEGRDAELYVLALRYFRGGNLASEEVIRKDIAAEAMHLSP